MHQQHDRRPIHPAIWLAVVVLGALAYILFFVTSVSAVRYSEQGLDRERGFYAGISFVASNVGDDSDPDAGLIVDEEGGGAQLLVGYSFNPVFSLELSAAGFNHDTSDPAVDAEFGALRLFALYRFRPGFAFRPYLKGGIGGYTLRLETQGLDARAEGGGVAVGGGFDYFFSRHFSVGVDYTFNRFEYNEVEVELNNVIVGARVDEHGAANMLGLALNFYF